jgi:hypothetical protein
MSDELWATKGWVGAQAVIAPMKAAMEAEFGPDLLNIVAPPRGQAPDLMSDEASGIFGFAIAVRPHVPLAVPEGAIPMAPHIAAVLLTAIG